MLTAGLLLRLLIVAGFRPAFWNGASQEYLDAVDPSIRRGTVGLGYTFYELVPVSWATSSMSAVSLLQHLAGPVAALAVYVVCVRWGVWRWLAVVAAAVPALDPRLVVAEHLVLPDAAFVTLCSLALLVLLWRRGPGLVAAVAVGLLLGAAGTILAAGGLLLLAGVLVWLSISVTARQRVLGAGALLAGFVAGWVPYAVWRGGAPGWQASWGLTGGGGLADVTEALQHLTPGTPTWDPTDAATLATVSVPDRLVSAGGHLSTHHPFDDAFVRYAQAISFPDWLLVAALMIGLAGAMGLGRARRSPYQQACSVVLALPLAAVVGTAFGSEHAWDAHLLLLLVWGPAAGALGLTALMRGARSTSAYGPQRDAVDDDTIERFADRYGRPELRPVVLVIAAYNEADGLPTVLKAVPESVCDLSTDVLIVDDGSTDGTAQVAESDPRAYVAACGRNRGQGAALRLGYRIAREHGARYVITTDADGQYDVHDFPVVLAPLLAGEADFVTGSRRLGHQHTYDRVRRLGVHVFAWIATLLTGVWVTDTSFGLRAMRAEVTGAVTLDQPQYQSSELLLGVITHGYRVLEVPGTMHLRAAGSTKKGRNLVYGARYARVMFGTWWREGCPRPAADRAPALRLR